MDATRKARFTRIAGVIAAAVGLLALIVLGLWMSDSSRRIERADEALAVIGRILDQAKLRTPPYSLLYELSLRDPDLLQLWWNFLRQHRGDDPPSAALNRLYDWFVKGKADKEFDATLAAARRYKGDLTDKRGPKPAGGDAPDRQARWLLAQALARPARASRPSSRCRS